MNHLPIELQRAALSAYLASRLKWQGHEAAKEAGWKVIRNFPIAFDSSQ